MNQLSISNYKQEMVGIVGIFWKHDNNYVMFGSSWMVFWMVKYKHNQCISIVANVRYIHNINKQKKTIKYYSINL